MNNPTYQASEKRRGIVINFANFSAPMIQNMKYDLGLCMDVSHLVSLQAYYKNYTRRDPSLDEIYLFDKIIQQRLYQSYPITKLFTNSDVIAETYADLMQKHSALTNAQNAPTAKSLTNVVRDYLRKCGKKCAFNDNVMVEHGEKAELELMLKRGTPTLSTYNVQMGYCRSNAAIMPGQLIVLMSKCGDMTDRDFRGALRSLLNSPSSFGIITGTFTAGKGLLSVICEYSTGAYIDITALPTTQPNELTSLCDLTSDYVLIVISQENVNTLLRDANTLGIWSSVVGSLSSDKRLTIRGQMGITVDYPLTFINNLMTPTQSIHAYPDNAAQLAANAGGYACRAIDVNAGAVLSSHSAPSTFFNAMYTTLSAISDCVAAGASYKDVCLALDICQPINQNCNDIALACLLGAYRAQIEYYISNIKTDFTHSAGAPTFKVYAMSPLTLSKPHKYSVADHDASSVYLLRPNIESNGLVNFEQLRKMWDYVTTLVQSGDILYAAAVSPNGINATINALTENTSTLTISDNCTDELLSSIAPGGILAITRTRLDGVFLGNLNIAKQ